MDGAINSIDPRRPYFRRGGMVMCRKPNRRASIDQMPGPRRTSAMAIVASSADTREASSDDVICCSSNRATDMPHTGVPSPRRSSKVTLPSMICGTGSRVRMPAVSARRRRSRPTADEPVRKVGKKRCTRPSSSVPGRANMRNRQKSTEAPLSDGDATADRQFHASHRSARPASDHSHRAWKECSGPGS